MKNKLITLVIEVLLLGGVTMLFPDHILAVDCTVPISGNISISSSCIFPGTINGADAGTGTTNTASVTVSNGATLTIGATQTIAVGSLVPSGGFIAIISGGQVKIGYPLWMTDADADGYPSATTQVIQASAPTNGKRRDLMASLSTLDCNDSAYSTANTCGLANGSACSTGGQCTSTYCVSSVCCSSSSCATPGVCQTGGGCAGGSCVAVSNAAAGTDPNNECNAGISVPLNSATGWNCNTMCSTQNIPDANCNGSGACATHTGTCVSVGTDYGSGTNGGKARWTSANGCFVQFGLDCTTTSGNNGVVCTLPAAWDYCRCQ